MRLLQKKQSLVPAKKRSEVSHRDLTISESDSHQSGTSRKSASYKRSRSDVGVLRVVHRTQRGEVKCCVGGNMRTQQGVIKELEEMTEI